MATPRAYAPANLDASRFEAIEPHYRELLGRTITSADELEQLILDRSDLDALVAEKQANLYIATTRNTEDKNAEAAFLGFVRDVEPKLKPIASELDKKIATNAHADALPKARYESSAARHARGHRVVPRVEHSARNRACRTRSKVQPNRRPHDCRV
jgi:oligoendopeptidase F